MASYIRRFLNDPGETVLLEIESVNILDLEPPTSIVGVGTGTALIVGEFENGPFNSPTEVTSATDLQNMFGGLGYTYAGVVGNYPCAVARYADGIVNPEYWNGNGFVQLNGKKFSRLLITRVDTSVGYLEFSRRAYLTGAAAFVYDLEPGETHITNIGGSDLTATFTATAAIRTGSGGVYPSTFAGGETLTLSSDDGAQFTTTFLAADQTAAQVAARINSYAGFDLADTSGGQLRLTSRRRGSSAKVVVVAGSTGVLTQLGLTALTTQGSGNVADIDQVTFQEVKDVIENASAGVSVEQDSHGRLRISNSATPLTGSIIIKPASTAIALGFPLDVTNDADTNGVDGIIPAGTLVRDSDKSQYYTTMQDIVVSADNAGPYQMKVRPAVDDGGYISTLVNTIKYMESVPDLGSFGATNPSALSAALTEAQLDAAYQTALDSTVDPNTVAHDCNIIWSARQSNAIRRALKQNAIDASANGLFGRIACVRTPMKTLKATALSTTSQPGVGATRDQRVVYCYPNANSFVPMIAKRGLAGGQGFTADGNVDIGFDGFVASIMSQLPPEENPGQLTSFTIAINGLESGLGSTVQPLSIQDYKNFKAAGIAALRMDNGVAVIQSGVTSVDPLVNPNLKNINRRRVADMVQDTLAKRGVNYGKKLSTVARRKAFAGEVRSYLSGLLSKDQPSSQRIAGYSVDDTSANTPDVLAKGRYRILVNVRTLASMDSIEIAVTAGESVEVTETISAR